MTGWQTVIGLEVHVQLLTRTKMFCGCRASYGEPPNTSVCPVCLGLPGALPAPNGEAVRLAVRAAQALGCTVHGRSVFARKNYFYPDLPKGYQITQYEEPLATGGGIEVVSPERGPVTVGITRLHLEEDAGRSFHDRFPAETAVDLNRSGVPLIEIVSRPDLVSPTEARAYLAALKQLLRWLHVSDCNMEEGSLRVDANVSVRRPGEPLGTRTEVKNMNSFSNVERALSIESARQVALVESGGRVEQRTMTFDVAKAEVRPVRSKEESRDYRYFPEPDLPPLVLREGWLEAERAALPELPAKVRRRFEERYGLAPSQAAVVTATAALADAFEGFVGIPGMEPREAWNWMANDFLAFSRDGESLPDLLNPRVHPHAEGLIGMVKAGRLSRQAARKVLARVVETGADPEAIAAREGLVQVRDAAAIERWVREVIEACPAEVARYRGGETKLLGYLTGQVMRRSMGKADPRAVNAALSAALGAC